jgi:8-oxo-dGTP pyrophosphatase MutT (NUDIX family)
MSASNRFSAGVVVIRHDQGELRVLVLRAYRNWDFPKGLVEAGESPIEAALRETAEETGLTDLVFTWGKVPLITNFDLALIENAFGVLCKKLVEEVRLRFVNLDVARPLIGFLFLELVEIIVRHLTRNPFVVTFNLLSLPSIHVA